MDPVAALRLLGGAARWVELEQRDVTRRELTAAQERGDVAKVTTGVYCLPGAHKAALTRAVSLNGVLSCGSAAVHHQLEVFGRPPLHVTVAGKRGATKGITVHRRAVDRDDRATRLHQTLLDCCRCLPTVQAVSVLDSALRQGRLEPGELMGLVPASGRWAGRVRNAVRLADASAHSVLESAARVLMLEGEVGSVETQVEIDRVGWVDFLVDGWLVVETDGYATHRTAFREDRRRDAELLRRGYLVLRFTYADIEGRPQWVLDVIRDTLRREGPAHTTAAHRRARDL